MIKENENLKPSVKSLLFTGDVCFCGQFQKIPDNSQGCIAQDLRTELECADVLVYNLEGPVLGSDKGEARVKDKTNLFNPHFSISELAKGKETLFNLSNNHLFDFGTSGLIETKKAIDGFRHHSFGAGCTLEEAIEPIIIPSGDIKLWFFTFTVDTSDAVGKRKPGVVTTKHLSAILKRIKSIPDKDFVFLNVHIGEEYTLIPSPPKRKLLHKIARKSKIDAIICHHSHSPQGVEWVNNTLICYSLGNFVFDFSSHHLYPYTNKGMLVRFDIVKNKLRPCFYFVKIQHHKQFVELLPFLPVNTLSLMNDFSRYRYRWEKEAYRVLFQRRVKPQIDQAGLKTSSPLNWFMKGDFYKKVFLLLFDPFNRSVYINALKYKLKHRGRL